MTASPRLLIVDDDPEIRKLLARYLEEQGFRVMLAGSRREMENILGNHQIDLAVLDVMLPDDSGLNICRDLRAARSRIPIILLTALKEDVDRIVGLEIGADDYLGKPFNPRELAARIRAVLRRQTDTSPTSTEKVYRFEGFVAEPATRTVRSPDGTSIELTGAEFNLLQVFLERPGRILSRDQLLDHTRGREGDVFDRSVDVLISRIRRKLSDAGLPSVFKTVRNGGYQIAVRVETVDSSS